jgi:hypothetical protein
VPFASQRTRKWHNLQRAAAFNLDRNKRFIPGAASARSMAMTHFSRMPVTAIRITGTAFPAA